MLVVMPKAIAPLWVTERPSIKKEGAVGVTWEQAHLSGKLEGGAGGVLGTSAREGVFVNPRCRSP